MAAVAQLYARAFSDVATKDGLDLTKVLAQLQQLADAFATSHELREIMGNPSIPLEQKLKVLDALAARMKLFPQVRNFVAVLLQRDRVGELQEVLAETRVQLDQQGGVIDAEIVTARELTAAQRKQLEQSVARMAGHTEVRATYILDGKLLGGATVRVGSTVFDGSIAGRLQRMKEQLSAQ
jgi:F-type H+-transporting ATPase subunit delta